MNKRTRNGLIAILVIAFGSYLGYMLLSGKWSTKKTKFQLDQVKRGNIVNTISSSGTISPVTTVEIGTQVSGTIAKVYVDFNDQVRKGQLLAVLDTSLLKAALIDAQAGLERSNAQLEEAQNNYDRYKLLYDKQVISAADFLPYYIDLKLQNANIKSARATLERAEYNLRYAVIRSPINGTVILRNVEAGQTVAASFSTPTLFEIAENLGKMEILAQVDESDIGSIKVGQDVQFQVQTYTEKMFYGKVKQVRLNPVTVSNVVNYIVVVSADNKDNYLLPGMTAMVDFITERADSVLLVPARALRFQPTAEMLVDFRKDMEKKMQTLPDSVRYQMDVVRTRRLSQNSSSAGTNNRNRSMNRIWYLDDQGNMMMARIIPGITDGKFTEIKNGRNVKEGMKIIVGFEESSGNTSSGTSTLPRFRRGF